MINNLMKSLIVHTSILSWHIGVNWCLLKIQSCLVVLKVFLGLFSFAWGVTAILMILLSLTGRKLTIRSAILYCSFDTKNKIHSMFYQIAFKGY